MRSRIRDLFGPGSGKLRKTSDPGSRYWHPGSAALIYLPLSYRRILKNGSQSGAAWRGCYPSCGGGGLLLQRLRPPHPLHTRLPPPPRGAPPPRVHPRGTGTTYGNHWSGSAIFVSDLQDVQLKKKMFSKFFFFLLFERYICIIFQI